MVRPTLSQFLFTLNQDEDILVSLIDYDLDRQIVRTMWKSDMAKSEDFARYKDWLVVYFEVSGIQQLNRQPVQTNLKLRIHISKEDPDND